MALGLSTVAMKMLRSAVGRYVAAEKLRRHALGADHPLYVPQPKLWTFAGPVVDGGGARLLQLQEHRQLIRDVLAEQRKTSKKQRKAGAPAPSESLLERAVRLQAGLTAAERLAPWPLHTGELEPTFAEVQQADE